MKTRKEQVIKFWEDKILTWERGRYHFLQKEGLSVLEIIANKLSSSLRRRVELAGELLAKHLAGKSVLEVGCGSGHLTKAILASGVQSYKGVDIAPAAIAAAKSRSLLEGWGQIVDFQVGDIDSLLGQKFDVVVSLGLTDWLSDNDLNALFALSRHGDFFHSISERKISISQLLHKIYVQLSYGYKTAGYKPRYFTVAEIERYVSYSGHKGYFFREPELSFGAFISSFEVKKSL